MANSVTNLDLISSSQAQKEITANALFDASGPATLFGRRSSTTSALTWGYYGGNINSMGSLITIANGTIQLTANTINYLESDAAGVVSVNTTGFTNNNTRLYRIITGATAVVDYFDLRCFLQFSNGTAYVLQPATATVIGGTKYPNGGALVVDANGNVSIVTATAAQAGISRPDDVTLSITAGVLKANTATTAQAGIVRPDGTTITIDSAGIISSTGGGGGGGLVNFTDAKSTASPNATVPVVSLTAKSTETNVDLALVSKGSGSIALHVADGTAANGNKRGLGSIDFNATRTAATQVTGADSFNFGRRNRADVNGMSVGVSNITLRGYSFGESNSTDGSSTSFPAFAFGQNNTSVGLNTFAIGRDNTSNGNYSMCLGRNNTTFQPDSIILGLYGASRINGCVVFSNGTVNASNGIGLQQSSKVILMNNTTLNANSVTLTTDTSSAGMRNQVYIANNQVVRFKGVVAVKPSTGNLSASSPICSFDIEGLIFKGLTADTIMLINNSVLMTGGTAAADTANINVVLSADTTFGCLKVTVSASSGGSLKAVAIIDTTEVI